MKKIQIIIIFFALIINLSCEDTDKNPLGDISSSAIVTMIINNNNISLDDSSVIFSADLDAQEDVASYEIRILRNSNIEDDAIPYRTFSSSDFPLNLSINAQDIADALSLNLDELINGDNINFYASTTSIDGTIITRDDFIGAGALNPGGSLDFNTAAYEFSIDIIN